MLSETANLSLSSSRDKKVSIKFYEYNACKDLEKGIQSLCWYYSINLFFKSMGRLVTCLCPRFKKLAL